MATMRPATALTDDELIARLRAPPDLRDGVDSLAYWRRRRKQLPWYRPAARREAARMIVAWEQRVQAALLAQRGVPMEARLEGALLIARTRLGRLGKRAALALATITAVALVFVLIPAAITLDVVLRAL
jgi:hypothetical protein